MISEKNCFFNEFQGLYFMRFMSLVAVIFLMNSSIINGQNDSSNTSYIAVKPQVGYIIPHTKTIELLSKSNPYGIEAEYGWFLTQQKDWERCNCYSKAGFSVLYIDYDNPSVIGQSINFLAYAEPFLNSRGNFLASIRMGVGASYLTKVYHEEKNPENMFFSTSLSYLVHLDANVTAFVSDHLFLYLYAKYNHISNGGVKKPNLGMNFPTFGLGMGYNFDYLTFPQKSKQPLQKPVKIIPYTGTFFTPRTIHVEGDDEFTLSAGTFLKARRKITRLNALSAGFEAVYDRSLFNKEEKREGFLLNSYYSFAAGHAFVFGRFIFSQEFGAYLYAPYYEGSDYFQRYALTFQFGEKFRAGVTLKAHAEVAENFNVILTYDLR